MFGHVLDRFSDLVSHFFKPDFASNSNVSGAVSFCKRAALKISQMCNCLEHRNLLKLRSLDSTCPFFLSDNSIWGR